MFSRGRSGEDPALLAEQGYLRNPDGLWYVYFVERVLELARIPAAMTWDQMLQKVETLYHKSIAFEAISSHDWTTQTGAWLDFPDKRKQGVIQFRAEDEEFYRRHTILHEFGHLLMRRVLPQTDIDLLEVLTDYYEKLNGEPAARAAQSEECRTFARGEGAGPEEVVAERLAFRLAKTVIFGSQPPEIRIFG